MFLITENWWFKNVYNEKEKHLFTVSWNSYGPIMSNKASWRQIRYNLFFFLLFFHSGQWWLSDLKPNHQCLLNLGLYVAEGRTDYHSEWNTCLAYSQGAKSHSSRWCISFEEPPHLTPWPPGKLRPSSSLRSQPPPVQSALCARQSPAPTPLLPTALCSHYPTLSECGVASHT